MDEKDIQVTVKQPAKQFRVQSGVQAGKGLGDLVADFTHLTGLDKLADWYTDTTGKDCGCDYRRNQLNDIAPDII